MVETTTSRNRSNDSCHHQRSISPSGRFCSFSRPTSPTRVNLSKFVPSTAKSSVRFFIDRGLTSFSLNSGKQMRHSIPSQQKKTCMCSPTTHPGSFRCSLHKNSAGDAKRQQYQSHHLHMRRSAMTNSLVRIGTVEGEDWVKRALATLIRPSSHQQRRRAVFHPRPSRLSIMSQDPRPACTD